MNNNRGKGIAILYQKGGPNLIAYRLGRVFTELKTDADVTLHNDVVREILDIINTGYSEPGKLTKKENNLFKFIATLLYQKIDRRKRFLFRLAEWIIRVGQKKG